MRLFGCAKSDMRNAQFGCARRGYATHCCVAMPCSTGYQTQQIGVMHLYHIYNAGMGVSIFADYAFDHHHLTGEYAG